MHALTARISRYTLLMTVALAPLHAQAAEPTVEELALRIQALEQRLGGAPPSLATATDVPLADLEHMPDRIVQ